MDHTELASMCKALGDPTRAHIVGFLLGCCCPVALEEDGTVRELSGSSVGEVCCHVTGSETITSSISFHLKELRNAGLVSAERRGKHILYSVNREAMARLADFFDKARECCACCTPQEQR